MSLRRVVSGTLEGTDGGFPRCERRLVGLSPVPNLLPPPSPVFGPWDLLSLLPSTPQVFFVFCPSPSPLFSFFVVTTPSHLLRLKRLLTGTERVDGHRFRPSFCSRFGVFLREDDVVRTGFEPTGKETTTRIRNSRWRFMEKKKRNSLF